MSHIVKIGVISDTHIPSRAPAISESILHFFRDQKVEAIFHAGDLTVPDVIDQLQYVAPVFAVRGNMDLHSPTRDLPEYREINRAGKTIGVIHGSGGPNGFVSRVYNALPKEKKPDIVICGHNHNGFVEYYEGILFFNPGSPTDTRFTQTNTIGLLDITEKTISPKLIDIEEI